MPALVLAGATLGAQGPAGNAEAETSQPRSVLVAGGISFPFDEKTSPLATTADPNTRYSWLPKNQQPVNGMVVVEQPIRTITLTADGETRPINVAGELVGQAVLDAGMALGPLDRVIPAKDTPVIPDMTITVVRVTEEERTETVAIPFSVVTSKNPNIAWGKKKIISKGVNGVKQERVLVRVENGSAVKRTVLSSKIVTLPEAQEEEIGTKITIGKVAEGIGSWYRFRKGMFAAATLFPRGSFVRVTNLENGKQAIVQVNDYGPTAPGRVIDLEAAAFQALGKPLWRGLMQVKVEEILP